MNNNNNTLDSFLSILSTALSYLLHPILMPTLIFTMVFYFCPIATSISPQMASKVLYMIIIPTTFVFPALSTLVLLFVVKKNLSVTDIYMEDHRERFYPFLLTGFFYAAVTYMFVKSGYDATMIVIMGGISLTVILVSIITYFWKISAHAVGICGALGYILSVSYYYPYELMLYPIAAVTFLAGVLMSARLYLNVHTPIQVFLGGLLGLVVSVLSYVAFQELGLQLIY
jgi:membrane-associated phospholipid phosphatase